jgi:hypothetical protein
MALDPVTGGEELANTIAGVIGKFIPDKQAQAQAQIEMMKVLQQADAAQAATNTAEAGSTSLFVSGWRPAAGWMSVAVLGTVYIPKAVATIAIWVYVCIIGHQFAPPPSLDVTDVLGLLGAMLGIGTMRTFEKTRGVA